METLTCNLKSLEIFEYQNKIFHFKKSSYYVTICGNDSKKLKRLKNNEWSKKKKKLKIIIFITLCYAYSSQTLVLLILLIHPVHNDRNVHRRISCERITTSARQPCTRLTSVRTLHGHTLHTERFRIFSSPLIPFSLAIRTYERLGTERPDFRSPISDHIIARTRRTVLLLCTFVWYMAADGSAPAIKKKKKIKTITITTTITIIT